MKPQQQQKDDGKDDNKQKSLDGHYLCPSYSAITLTIGAVPAVPSRASQIS
jgi:hypothetical protein